MTFLTPERERERERETPQGKQRVYNAASRTSVEASDPPMWRKNTPPGTDVNPPRSLQCDWPFNGPERQDSTGQHNFADADGISNCIRYPNSCVYFLATNQETLTSAMKCPSHAAGWSLCAGDAGSGLHAAAAPGQGVGPLVGVASFALVSAAPASDPWATRSPRVCGNFSSPVAFYTRVASHADTIRAWIAAASHYPLEVAWWTSVIPTL
jgi:hypothetical protein